MPVRLHLDEQLACNADTERRSAAAADLEILLVREHGACTQEIFNTKSGDNVRGGCATLCPSNDCLLETVGHLSAHSLHSCSDSEQR